MLNTVSMKSKATLLGKVFRAHGVTLSRKEQLDTLAQLEGARNWAHYCAEANKASTRTAAGAPETLVPLQKLLLEHYARGEFSWLTDTSEAQGVGDMLLPYLLSEAKDAAQEPHPEHALAEALEQASRELENLSASFGDIATAAADNVAPCRYIVSEGWGHCFVGSKESTVRFVYDRRLNRLIECQVHVGGARFEACSAAETEDVFDSVARTNAVFEAPDDWFDVYQTNELPTWA